MRLRLMMLLALLLPSTLPAASSRALLVSGASTVIVDGQPPRQGSARITEIVRELPAFERIELRSAEPLWVRRGPVPRLRLIGDDNLLELIATEVRGGTLVVEARGSYRARQPLRIEVELPSLSALSVPGGANAVLEALDPEHFQLVIDGSSTVEATGQVQRLEIELNGSGDARLAGVRAGQVKAELNGSGNIEVQATGDLLAELNGSGDIVYSGDPDELRVQVNGSGRIHRRH